MRSQHSAFFDTVEPRIVAALGFSMTTGGVAPRDVQGLVEYFEACAASCNAMAANEGWETRPPLPGLTSGVEAVGSDLRIRCATKLWSSSDLLGVVFIVVLSGRIKNISVGPPGCSIPSEWRIADA